MNKPDNEEHKVLFPSWIVLSIALVEAWMNMAGKNMPELFVTFEFILIFFGAVLVARSKRGEFHKLFKIIWLFVIWFLLYQRHPEWASPVMTVFCCFGVAEWVQFERVVDKKYHKDYYIAAIALVVIAFCQFTDSKMLTDLVIVLTLAFVLFFALVGGDDKRNNVLQMVVVIVCLPYTKIDWILIMILSWLIYVNVGLKVNSLLEKIKFLTIE